MACRIFCMPDARDKQVHLGLALGGNMQDSNDCGQQFQLIADSRSN
jgi:hypothetical protein